MTEPAQSSFTESVLVLGLTLTSVLVTLSFQDILNVLLRRSWWAASSRFDTVAVSGNSSTP